MRFALLFCAVLFGLSACSIKLKPTAKEVVVEMPDINGFWQLLYINGTKVTKEQSGKEIPTLAFKTADNSLTGTTGCNRITGKIRVTPYLVDFENLQIQPKEQVFGKTGWSAGRNRSGPGPRT